MNVAASPVTKATVARIAVMTVTMVTDVVISVGVDVTRRATSSRERARALVHRAGSATTVVKVITTSRRHDNSRAMVHPILRPGTS